MKHPILELLHEAIEEVRQRRLRAVDELARLMGWKDEPVESPKSAEEIQEIVAAVMLSEPPNLPTCPECGRPDWIQTMGECQCGYRWPKEATPREPREIALGIADVVRQMEDRK